MFFLLFCFRKKESLLECRAEDIGEDIAKDVQNFIEEFPKISWFLVDVENLTSRQAVVYQFSFIRPEQEDSSGKTITEKYNLKKNSISRTWPNLTVRNSPSPHIEESKRVVARVGSSEIPHRHIGNLLVTRLTQLFVMEISKVSSVRNYVKKNLLEKRGKFWNTWPGVHHPGWRGTGRAGEVECWCWSSWCCWDHISSLPGPHVTRLYSQI